MERTLGLLMWFSPTHSLSISFFTREHSSLFLSSSHSPSILLHERTEFSFSGENGVREWQLKKTTNHTWEVMSFGSTPRFFSWECTERTLVLPQSLQKISSCHIELFLGKIDVSNGKGSSTHNLTVVLLIVRPYKNVMINPQVFLHDFNLF